MGLSCPTVTELHCRQGLKAFPTFPVLHSVYYLAIQGNHIVLFLTNPSSCHPVCLDVFSSMLFTFARDWIFHFFFFSIIKTAFVDLFSSSFLFSHKVLKIWGSISQLNKLPRMKLIGRRYILVDDYLIFFSYYNLWVWFWHISIYCNSYFSLNFLMNPGNTWEDSL